MPIDIPADPAPQGYVTNPYEKEQAWALDYLKREALSTDGWIDIGALLPPSAIVPSTA